MICGIHDISENGSDRILMEVRNVASAGFLGGSVVRNRPASAGDAGDAGSILGLGRSLG